MAKIKKKKRMRDRAAVIMYYIAVRLFGFTCFHYADKERDEVDLKKIMEGEK